MISIGNSTATASTILRLEKADVVSVEKQGGPIAAGRPEYNYFIGYHIGNSDYIM